MIGGDRMDPERLDSLLSAFRQKRLLVVGDVMLDRFIWGAVSRISPEAPVPVVEVKSEDAYPGGAANVARNLLPFCANVRVAGLVGDDVYAGELDGLLSASGIDTAGLLRDPEYQTIVKTRIVASAIFAQDNQVSLARIYGAALTTGLTAASVKEWPAKIRAVTPEAVRDAAKKWLDLRRAVTGYLVKPGEKRS